MTCRVFLADDDPDLRVLVRMLLDAEGGYDVVGEAGDGVDALAFIDECEHDSSRTCPDVMILDLNMPRLDGFEVIRRLRAACDDVTVVVWSGEDADAARRKIDFGAIRFVQKGNPMELLQELNRVCARESS